ncbi:MAG TPA: heparan-alpha-glucosaminide N-acetyltransferase domain-containing protein, partial [Flavisolibacter sp.]|nr:heparan-alpha-glucosaminide N-acetyltransferase domain-containing protein [Flavisolibacter sp.]
MEEAIVHHGAQVMKRKMYRVTSIDLLRGLVMIIMALDHTRDIFHNQSQTGNPLDLRTTFPLLFFTRWITHFCAPVFAFLAGTSIYLQGIRKTRKELSLFLLKRGIWLILIDFFLMSFIMTFNIHFSFLVLEVLWAIGGSMILTALVMFLPYRVILCLGLLIVSGHNLLDYWEQSHGPIFPLWYSLLHRQGFYPIGKSHLLGILYPLLPWLGIVLCGYCFGKIFERYKVQKIRKKKILLIGGIGLILFILLRFVNIYGDPGQWSVQKNGLYTLLSFINVQKYPPSLLFTCLTLGPSLLFL